jgi:DNA-binding XRE family transcriptional regulator
MSFALPKPKTESDDEVVLSRKDWDAIVRVLGGLPAEDEDDIAAVIAARDDDARFAARIAAERGGAIKTEIPIEVVRAKLDGAHPIKAWRDYRGWTQVHLNFKSGVGRDLIAQIETRRKKGSIDTLGRLARALETPIEALIEEEDS